MLEAVGGHDSPQIWWSGKKIEAGLLQPLTAVLLGQRQDGCCRADVDVLAQLLLADQLQPPHAIPVCSNEQMLAYDYVFLELLRQQAGVCETEQRLEHLRVHVFHAHDAGITLLHGSKELGGEHRRAGREHAPVCRDGLAADLKHHVGAHPGVEEPAKVLTQVTWGHRDEGRHAARGAVTMDDNDIAPDGERIVGEIL
uniref:Uncharacterized protein n=1 Tax=Triticum urartu TaxID=4572 RepID=A0A8R7UVK9_TRIUA